MKTNAFRAVFALNVILVGLPLAAQPFNKYVALGDSITAAVQGACLVERHQIRSYSKVIATQLGIADFQQPIVGEAALVPPIGTACLGAVVANMSITVGGISQQGNPKNATLMRAYDNLGIPSARAQDLVDLKTSNPTLGGVQASAALVLRNVPGSPFNNTSALDQARVLNPNLVTVWIGNNDVLGALTTAVAVDGVTLTRVADFEPKYTEVLSGLRASGRTVVVLNIPDVAAIPFGTTVPPVVVNPQTRQPVLVNGQPVSLLGSRTFSPSCPVAPCPVPLGTLVTIQALPLLAQGIGIPTSLGGTGQPLPDGSFTPPSTLTPGVLLYPDEVALIRERTNTLNARISSIAAANGAVLLDVNAIFDGIKANGYTIGGVKVTKDFLTGGLFSADGVHPSNIGQVIVADEIIKTLNAARSTAIERPNIAAVLFTPDVPVFGGSSIFQPEIVLEDAPGAWAGLLQMFPPVDDSVQLVLPTDSDAPVARAPVSRISPRGRQ